MEHVLLSGITIGSEELAISRELSDETLILTNQASASIDRQGNCDKGFSFVSHKSCKKMSIDLRRNTNNGIPMNPSRTVWSITPQISSLESGAELGQNSDAGRNSGGIITPINIRSFSLFDKGTLYLSNRSASCYVTAKYESENFGDNNIFENSESENIFEVKKLGAKIL